MKPVKTKADSNVYSIWKQVFNSIIDGRTSDEVYNRPNDILPGIEFSRISALVLNDAYKSIKP